MSSEPQGGGGGRNNKREAGEGREGEVRDCDVREVGEGAAQEDLLSPLSFPISLEQQNPANTEVTNSDL